MELDAVHKITDVLRASQTVIDLSVIQLIEGVAEPIPEPESASAKDVPALKPRSETSVAAKRARTKCRSGEDTRAYLHDGHE